jgi:N,N-dimethylformamidase
MTPTIAFVSDEYFFAVPDAQVELTSGSAVVSLRSSASGAVRGELEPGVYAVVVSRPGYGPKRSQITLAPGRPPAQLRLLRDSRVYGYLWPKYVRSGEASELRVHSSEPYRAELWHYGWEATPVADLGLYSDMHPASELRQLLPDGDFTQTGVRWLPNFMGPRQTLTAPERSGLYYVRVETVSGKSTSFPWIVAPRKPSARIAVLASNLTWNAYNDFGGRSNYVAMDKLPEAPSVSARQENVWCLAGGFAKWSMESYAPISFDRPEPLSAIPHAARITDPIEPLGTEHVAAAEWRLLGWLEREGYAYDLYAESQLNDGTLDLDAYAVIILNAHPEYWTRHMYERLRDWVYERGGKLAYIGGNGIDCEVTIDDTDTMTVQHGDISAGFGEYENRFGLRGIFTGSLLGVACSVAGMGTAAPYQVLDAAHWIFTDTDLRDRDLFGTASLDVRNPGGASGHETDKLSAYAPAGTLLLARGTNPDNGGADITYHETPSGGAVYSVGSISYVCSIPVDHTISTITRNVLNHFLHGDRGGS